MIVSRPTIRTDNGKADLTLYNFNKLLGQLEGLHLNKKGKNRLELKFLQKLRNL